VALRPVTKPLQLKMGTFAREDGDLTECFDLPRGESRLVV